MFAILYQPQSIHMMLSRLQRMYNHNYVIIYNYVIAWVQVFLRHGSEKSDGSTSLHIIYVKVYLVTIPLESTRSSTQPTDALFTVFCLFSIRSAIYIYKQLICLKLKKTRAFFSQKGTIKWGQPPRSCALRACLHWCRVGAVQHKLVHLILSYKATAQPVG